MYRVATALSFIAAVSMSAFSQTSIAQESAPGVEAPAPEAPKVDPKREKAKKHFAACIAFLNDPEGKKWEEAYPECKLAYELSGSLNALNNLALCAQNLELDGEAISHYRKLLKDVDALKAKGMTDENVMQLRSDLTRLESTVAWVRINTDQAGVTITDERTPRRGLAVRNEYKASIKGIKLGIHPGAHVFTASADGFPDQTWKISLKNGKTYSHDFVFDKNAPVTADGFTEADQKEMTGDTPSEGDEAGARPIPGYVWATGGVTLAAGGAMAGMMVMASGKKSDYEALRGVAPIAEQQEAFDAVKQANLISDVLLGVTAASAVTTIVLFATRPTVAPEEGEASKTSFRFGRDWTIAPAAHAHGGGAWMTARF